MTESEIERIKKAKVKLARFCAYRERTHAEAKSKALEIGLRMHEAEELLSQLISENFINERRFAQVYATDKFRLNKWGKIKILQGLQQKQLSERCIQYGLKEIDQDDYERQLAEIIWKKFDLVKEDDLFIKNRKVAEYTIRKGYEPDLVWGIIKRGRSVDS